MKRIAIILLTFTFHLSPFTLKAQDLYQIDQKFDHNIKVNHLEIQSGWDARLIQVPEGERTRVMVTTPCAHFFENIDEEPTLLSVKKSGKHDGYYALLRNQWMPRTTVVEIFTAQPIEDIYLEKNARLTIAYYDFDSIDLEITADSGAVLVVDTLINRGTTGIMLTNATLDLRHVTGGKTNVTAYAHSTVKKGDIQSEYHQSDYERAPKMLGMTIGLGLNISLPVAFSSNQQGSPYNTNHAFEFHILGQISTMSSPPRTTSWCSTPPTVPRRRARASTTGPSACPSV